MGPRLIPSLQKKIDSMQSTEFTVHHNVYVIKSSISFYILHVPWKHSVFTSFFQPPETHTLEQQLEFNATVKWCCFDHEHFYISCNRFLALWFCKDYCLRFRVGKKSSESLFGSEDPQSCGNSLQRKSFSSRQQVQTKLGRIHREWDGLPFMLSFYFFYF